jgi:hypothetical protein
VKGRVYIDTVLDQSAPRHGGMIHIQLAALDQLGVQIEESRSASPSRSSLLRR